MRSLHPGKLPSVVISAARSCALTQPVKAQGSPASVGLTALRALTTFLPSTGQRQGRELAWHQAGSSTGAEAAAVGQAPDGNCNANAEKQTDSNDNPGDGSRTQAVLRC